MRKILHVVCLFFFLSSLGCKSNLYVMPSIKNQSESGDPKVFAMSRLNAPAGSIVEVSGLNLVPGLRVIIAGKSVSLSVSSSSRASFIMPEVSGASIGATFLSQADQTIAIMALVTGNVNIPVMDVDAALVCSDINYQTPEGVLKSGQRTCTSGQAPCIDDGQVNCIATASNPSVIKASLNPGLIRSGSTLAGVVGNYPSATYPLAGNTSLPDLTTFASQMTSNADFEYFDSSGQRYAARGDSDLISANVRLGSVLENISLTGTMPFLRGPGLSIASRGYNSANLAIDNQCCASTGVLIVRSTNSAVTWSPANGTTYSSGASVASGQTIVSAAALSTFVDTGLSGATRYFYKVWAYDADHNYSATASTTETITLPGPSFTEVNLFGTPWVKRGGVGVTFGFPGVTNENGGTFQIVSCYNYQSGIAAPLRKYSTPMTINFKYLTLADGADGFAVSWAKDLAEIETHLPNSGAFVGTSTYMGASGYGVLFETYGTNHVKLVDFSTQTELARVDVDLENPLNTQRDVRLVITANNVKVYLFGSTTATLDYTNVTSWQSNESFVVFSGATGGVCTDYFLSAFSITNP